MSLSATEPDLRALCLHINEQVPEGGLFSGEHTAAHPDSRLPWRISPEPFWLTPAQYRALEELGPVLLRFYRAANLLYQHSQKGLQPPWVHEYLDLGKPERILELGRMNRFRSHLPLVIRPDLLLTEDGFRLTELDSVPGGMGLTGQLAGTYSGLGFQIAGGARGLVDGFYEALKANSGMEHPAVAIVVSDESEAYRGEMQWLASQLAAEGYPVSCRHPRDLRFDEGGLLVEEEGRLSRVDMVYRFFELFDLPNIPKVELLTYFAKKNAVRVTPPLKAYLEEKLWLAFFRHPLLQAFWERELGGPAMQTMHELIPRSWILDPRPLPPHAVIPDLQVDGRPVNDWGTLAGLAQKKREFALKPSGFSALAWGSRGVAIGHDLPEEEWAARLREGLERFPSGPYVLQEFHKSAQVRVQYFDFAGDQVRPMRGRPLLRPYYYVIGTEPRLVGIQAIVCPPDKKILHGMSDAILVPCAVAPEEGSFDEHQHAG
jgi:hypothetical protein